MDKNKSPKKMRANSNRKNKGGDDNEKHGVLIPNGINIIDGKDRNMSGLDRKKLEDLLVAGSMNPYGTFDESLFQDKLNKMTLNEMQFLASRVGIVPHSDKSSLRKQLESSFTDFRLKTGGLGGNINPQVSIDKDNPHYDEIMKLINR